MKPRVIAVGWVLLVGVLLLLSPFAVRDRLPDPMATHWGGSGLPDSAASLTGHVLTSVLIWAVTGGILVAVAAYGRGRIMRMYRACWWGVLFGMGVLLLGVNASTLAANLDVPDWRSALLPGWHIAAALGSAVVAGAVCGYLGRGEPDEPSSGSQAPPRLRLEPGRRTVWIGHVTNPWLVVAGLGSLAVTIAAVMLTVTGPGSGAVLTSLLPVSVIVLVVSLATMSLTVRVGGERVVIGFGPLGWPRRRIPLLKIDSAWSEPLHPGQVGGWGFRGVPGSATIMLRGGECLVVRYRSGGRLAISVDDAEHGASLINALIAERVNP
ncbi:DUF1648 domain-containing protein [Nonomuraea terrae]|uniref:DUF1648 domain-containing protein n=1 Tax=Nonomuraea terrae TaxID=2530383 RepID=A0A4R4Y435_9ACTN|nr:DUF1648 domain-containing protein [Nonomuraea terrae]TDD38933.1 DUF1648 domain-containing protein [Nonomuraea terrae]